MRAATRKLGWWKRRNRYIPLGVFAHHNEMRRRKDMRHVNRKALNAHRMEVAEWMMKTPGLHLDDVAENRAKHVDTLLRAASRAGRYMDQPRHGTTHKLIPCQKEWPDDYEPDTSSTS